MRSLNFMTSKEFITVSNRGMITIPPQFRKKFNLQGGSKLAIIEDDGKLELIPIKDLEELRPFFPTRQELLETWDEDEQKELELEK